MFVCNSRLSRIYGTTNMYDENLTLLSPFSHMDINLYEFFYDFYAAIEEMDPSKVTKFNHTYRPFITDVPDLYNFYLYTSHAPEDMVIE